MIKSPAARIERTDVRRGFLRDSAQDLAVTRPASKINVGMRWILVRPSEELPLRFLDVLGVCQPRLAELVLHSLPVNVGVALVEPVVPDVLRMGSPRTTKAN